jgi:hypothetical protein
LADSHGRRETGHGPGSTPAIVLFASDTQVKWLRFLHPGFRHCLVAVKLGPAWIVMDPLSHKTALSVVEGFSADELVRWYEERGLKAIRTWVREAPAKLAPLAPATCVEAVKRILGIHAWWIITPRQLHDHLALYRGKSLDMGEKT